MKNFLFLCALLLTGCCSQTLQLYTEFIGVEQYASYHVGTPDPYLCCPELGQILVVKWDLPPHICRMKNLHVDIRVRYYDGSEEQIIFPVRKRDETRIWKVVDDLYNTCGGIATYKAILFSEFTPLYTHEHLLWNETIQVGQSGN